jgi:hypothetical protein
VPRSTDRAGGLDHAGPGHKGVFLTYGRARRRARRRAPARGNTLWGPPTCGLPPEDELPNFTEYCRSGRAIPRLARGSRGRAAWGDAFR